MAINIIALRIDTPNQNKVIGDIVDVIDSARFAGASVNKIGEQFVQIVVTDMLLDDPLVRSLRLGEMRFTVPSTSDPIFIALKNNGQVVATKTLLTQYLTAV